MKHLKKLFNIVRSILKLVVMLFVAFLLWWLILIPITNNLILNGYVKEIKQYAKDSNFEIIEDIRACGKLYGNGNGMEYMVMLLVKSDEELEETSMFTTGSWEGYYILYSLHSAAWDSVLTWDIRAH